MWTAFIDGDPKTMAGIIWADNDFDDDPIWADWMNMCYTHVTWITHRHNAQCENHNNLNVSPLKVLHIQV